MPENAADDLKLRLRADLRKAMKERLPAEVKVLRALLAAIDNAEAPPLPEGSGAAVQHAFASGSAEVERRRLGRDDLHRLLAAEIQEIQQAAAELQRRGREESAEALRAEALVARRYLE